MHGVQRLCVVPKKVYSKNTQTPSAAVAVAVAAAARDDDCIIITYEFHEPGKAEACIDRSGRWRRRLGDPVSREDDAAAGPDCSSCRRVGARRARARYIILYTRVMWTRRPRGRSRRRLRLVLVLFATTTTTTTTTAARTVEANNLTSRSQWHDGRRPPGRWLTWRHRCPIRRRRRLPSERARAIRPIVRRIARLAATRSTDYNCRTRNNTYTILYNFIIRTGTRAYYNVILLLLLLLLLLLSLLLSL